jgi:hypothetical protein
MKQIMLTILLLTSLVTAGCGGEVTIVASTGNGVIVVTTETNPSITLAQFRKDTAARVVFGSIDFHTPLSDINTMTISVTDSNGAVISRSVYDLAAFRGLNNGTIPFSIDYATYLPGTYTFAIFVTTMAGTLSNPVFGLFGVP